MGIFKVLKLRFPTFPKSAVKYEAVHSSADQFDCS